MPHGFNDNKTKADIATIAANAVANKIDKVAGMGLSDNNYTDAEKAIVDAFPTNLGNKVDKVTGKSLSTLDFTAALKSKCDETSYNTFDGSSVVLAQNGRTDYSSFTCPHDGYIQMTILSSSTTSPYFEIYTPSGNFRIVNGAYADVPSSLTFVRKGMVVKNATSYSNTSVIYYPLTSYT